MIYLDSTATTPVSDEVLKAYEEVATKCWYNASSIYKVGLQANQLFEKAEKVCLDALGVTNKKIVFTSGATEANNLAIYGVCNNYLNQNKKIITTSIEHPSVLSCFNDLEKKGFKVVYLDVLENGQINLETLKKEIDNDTILVSIMWVNNIIGAIQPIDKVIEIVRKYPRVKLHVDAVQGLAKLKPHFSFNDVDMFTMSAHKINGLKGTGALFYQSNINLNAPLKGSMQQDGLKPGTINVAGSVACAKAIQIATKNMDEHFTYVKELNDYFRDLVKENPDIIINSPSFSYSPYIINISILNINSETMLHIFEKHEIYLSAGSACNSKQKTPERTVLAVTNNKERALSSIRISFSYLNTKEEIDTLVKVLEEITSSKTISKTNKGK